MKNSNASEQKLLHAVGFLLETQGFKSLTATRISQVAGVDKKLIYTYFETLDKLIEAYIFSHDYWANTVRKVNDAIDVSTSQFKLEEIINFYLEKQLDMLQDDEILRQILLWGILENNSIIENINEQREQVGSSLFHLLQLEKPDINPNFQAVYAILVAGIYHLVLHSKTNNGTFCGINLQEEGGKKKIL